MRNFSQSHGVGRPGCCCSPTPNRRCLGAPVPATSTAMMSTAEGPIKGRDGTTTPVWALWWLFLLLWLLFCFFSFSVRSFVRSFVGARLLACLCCQENTKSCPFEVVSGFLSFSLAAHTVVEKFEQTPLQHDTCTVCGALTLSTRAFRRIVCIILTLCLVKR